MNLTRLVVYGTLALTAGFTAYTMLKINESDDRQSRAPDTSIAIASPKAPPQCTLVAGHIWAEVKLYQDSTCQKQFAKIVSASKDQVFIQFDSGEVETKSRDALKSQAYVMTNDPAIP